MECRGEPDLAPQHERWLGEWAQDRARQRFPLRHRLPDGEAPVLRTPTRPTRTTRNSFDLLFRGTELVTGGQRLHRYRTIWRALEAHGLPVAAVRDYLEAFSYGMPPHGGFAIGLERLLMQLLGLPNVKLATLFPRDLNRLDAVDLT